jgi:hypothetical protein
MVTPPPGCTDPGRWLDAYLIAEAHRAERGVCACGRPLPCIAAQRADEIMADTMQAADEAARAAEAAAAVQRAISSATTQNLPVVRLVPQEEAAPVGARFYRPRRGTDGGGPAEAPPPAPVESTAPASSAAPTGARFYRERKAPRHRS